MGSWYTSDEINFIDWLGTGTYTRQSPILDTMARNRLALLRGYQKGMALRTNWEHLDHKKIKAHLTHLIKSIEQSTNQGDK